MMNIPPSEAKALSMEEYEMLLHGWNKAHGSGDDIKAPDPVETQRRLDAINNDPRFTT